MCAQALGKHYNTDELIQQLGSTKPMADIWKSGIERTAHGCARVTLWGQRRLNSRAHFLHRRVDTSAWRLLGSHESGFNRLQAPVVFLRATSEDSSLFNFSFDDEYDGASYGACAHARNHCARFSIRSLRSSWAAVGALL